MFGWCGAFGWCGWCGMRGRVRYGSTPGICTRAAVLVLSIGRSEEHTMIFKRARGVRGGTGARAARPTAVCAWLRCQMGPTAHSKRKACRHRRVESV
eukprot:364208-Chlamydomonas_euryale.AAC.21